MEHSLSLESTEVLLVQIFNEALKSQLNIRFSYSESSTPRNDPLSVI